MDRRARMRVHAFVLAAVLIAAATPGFAQSSTTDQDHATHHPPAAGNAPAERGEMEHGGMSEGMMDQGPSGMLGGDMAQMHHMRSMTGAHDGPMTNGGMRSDMMGAMCDAMAGHIDGRLAFIKAELKVTDAQESLWSTYADTVRDNAKVMQSHCTAMMNRRGAIVSVPDRLEQCEQLMAAHLEALRAMNSALKPLYASLSDDQKKSADELFSGLMGMM